MMLGLNWNVQKDEDVKSEDILNFGLSLRDKISITNIFKISENSNNKEYNIKALVCFVGAHYLIFIRS